MIEIPVFIAGALLVLWTLNIVVRSVIVPRGERILTTRIILNSLLGSFRLFSRLIKDYKRRDAAYARIAPISLLLMPGVWSVGIVFGFSGMFWALNVRPWVDSLILSGSSLTTLGFRDAPDNPSLGLSILEALIGLGLVALVVSYLPSIYSVFSSREIRVSNWANRAGSPPRVDRIIYLANEIGLIHRMNDEWQGWEHWFQSLGESHLTHPSLNFFRSPSTYNSWVTTAGSVLDTAAFVEAAVDVPTSIEAQLCIQSGYTSLQRIGEYFRIPFDKNPDSGDPISYKKEEFISLYMRLEGMGVPMKPDIDEAWADFAGWRVNYDAVLIGLENLINRHL